MATKGQSWVHSPAGLRSLAHTRSLLGKQGETDAQDRWESAVRKADVAACQDPAGPHALDRDSDVAGVQCSEGGGERTRKTEGRGRRRQERGSDRERGGDWVKGQFTRTGRKVTFPWPVPMADMANLSHLCLRPEDLEHRGTHRAHRGPSTDLFPFKAITNVASAEMARKGLHTM